MLMHGEVTHGDGAAFWTGASLDSRRIASGAPLFFAIDGENNDGHDFVVAALEAGAAAAVVHKEVDLTSLSHERESAGVIRVADTYLALHELTRAVRRTVPEKLVAITGSSGKTTTKEFLAALLAVEYKTAATPGNLNNLFGFPLSLLGIPDDCEWMVAEMGMSLPGELAEVSLLGKPDVALFTNIREVHLEGFEDQLEDGADPLKVIADAKSGLLAGHKRGGLIVANACDENVVWLVERHLEEVDETAHVVWYAIDWSTALRAPDIWVRDPVARPAPLVGTRFMLEFPRADGSAMPRDVNISLPVHGAVNVENFLAAAACAMALDIHIDQIAVAGEELGPVAGRGALLAHPSGALVIDDSYNSNPDALGKALEAAHDLTADRRWCLLGDMLELGASSEAFHREALSQAKDLGFDPIWLVGEQFERAASSFEEVSCRSFSSAEDAFESVEQELRDGDVLLIKASRGVGLDRVVSGLVTDDENGEDSRGVS